MSEKRRTYQFIELGQKYSWIYFGTITCVFIFSLFFQPFNLDEFEFENKLVFAAGLGLLSFLGLLIPHVVFHAQLTQLAYTASDKRINIYIIFSLQFVLTSLSFIFYLRYAGQIPVTYNTIVRVIFICIFPPAIFHIKGLLDAYHFRTERLSNENRALQSKLKKFEAKYTNTYVTLTSENKAEDFTLLVSEIVYARSADNYVEIAYEEAGIVKKRMLRNTLKNIEQQFFAFSYFIRTHRTCIVNIKYIKELHKSFNSHWLSLENSIETIPVSRQYLLSVKELI